MSQPVVATASLTKKFGSLTAVDAINLEINEGEIFGFIGPNGSGKTTTIRMLCGIIEPTSGRAQVAGFDVKKDPEKIREVIGYSAQKFSLYDDLTANENLEFFSNLYETGPNLEKDELFQKLGIAQYKNFLTSNLSGGTKQKLSLACAISHQPKILFLDEPTAGVDPLSSREIWEILYTLARSGITLFITTHYMNEAERCNQLAFIYEGRIIARGTPHQLKTEAIKEKIFEVRGEGNLIKLIADFKKLPSVLDVNMAGEFLHVTTQKPEDFKRANDDLAKNLSLKLETQEILPALEDVFTNLTRRIKNEPS